MLTAAPVCVTQAKYSTKLFHHLYLVSFAVPFAMPILRVVTFYTSGSQTEFVTQIRTAEILCNAIKDHRK
jgi:hypothetical protein